MNKLSILKFKDVDVRYVGDLSETLYAPLHDRLDSFMHASVGSPQPTKHDANRIVAACAKRLRKAKKRLAQKRLAQKRLA